MNNEYLYAVTVSYDSKPTHWTGRYQDALSAVSVFDSFTDNIIFDTIISNPPHFKTKRPGGYRNENEKLISLDENMEFHIKFFKDVKKFMDKDSRIILVENCDGVTEEDIREMTKNDFRIELVEYDKYGWQGESTFYTIILYLL
jgi:methylase of polypeptide subunit release factors